MHPLGFRIWDFKSINDSGYCSLSEDRITVLAGQNEAGKTSILTALRDFDLSDGESPETPDYLPDLDPEKRAPRAAVKFSVTPEELDSLLQGEEKRLPEEVKKKINSDGHVWVFRLFNSGSFTLDTTLQKLFPPVVQSQTSGKAQTAMPPATVPAPATPATTAAPTPSVPATTVTPTSVTPSVVTPGSSTQVTITSADEESKKELPLATARQLASAIRKRSTYFTYFDSFQDQLPREVSIQSLCVASTDEARQAAYEEMPMSVRDFMRLAEMDSKYLAKVYLDDKALGNYLSGKAANITGHFLKYWKQRSQDEQTIRLRAQHNRKASGELFLTFYVHDSVDQYPDQRSRGFLWFLSFFLRLTAARLDENNLPSLVLIDEPGSFLHNRAQKDVLSLFEDWIVRSHWVLYSTHSPYLLPADKLYRVRLVGKEKGKGTYIADRITDARLKGRSFSDALSPVLTSIGLDLTHSFDLVKKKNVIVEGISDYYYLHGWNSLYELKALDEVSVFPGTSASTVPTLASLLIGWGVHFCALLDRDNPGNGAVKKLRDDMGISASAILQPKGGVAIEDLMELSDFEKLVSTFDPTIKVDKTASPSKNVTKLGIDKVLLARHFAESIQKGSLKQEDLAGGTKESVLALFKDIERALEQKPV